MLCKLTKFLLTCLCLLLIDAATAHSKLGNSIGVEKRMFRSGSIGSENAFDEPYRIAGFATTPLQTKFLYLGPILRPLTESTKDSRYSRFIHHNGFPVFPIKDTDIGTMRQGLADYDRIYYHYNDLDSGRLEIGQQAKDQWRLPSPEVFAQIAAKVDRKHALIDTGVPRDVADLVHGKPFSARRGKFAFWGVPTWYNVKRKAPEIAVTHAANDIVSERDFSRLRDYLARYRMVKLTNTFTGNRFALRLDRLGQVEFKVLKALY